jgi:hypothetical protein
MSKEVVNKDVATAIDGFDGYEDRIEGEDQDQSFGRVIQGEKWSFTADGKWMNDSDEEISPTREVTVVDICRVVQKWIDGMPVETRFLAPGEKIPDLETLNKACPQSEWSEDLNGKPRGPWQFQNVVYMADENMAKITYPTGTIGGGMCVRELADKVVMTRKFRGAHVYPVVRVSTKWMNTKFGGRNRPAFEIVRWISFGGATHASPALEAASPQPALPPTNENATGAQAVPEVSLREELNDDLPF